MVLVAINFTYDRHRLKHQTLEWPQLLYLGEYRNSDKERLFVLTSGSQQSLRDL